MARIDNKINMLECAGYGAVVFNNINHVENGVPLFVKRFENRSCEFSMYLEIKRMEDIKTWLALSERERLCVK